MNRFSKLNSRWLLLVIVIVALAARWLTFTPIKVIGFDEHAYLNFARILDHFGLDGIREMAARYSTDPELSKSPLPYRIGFVAAAVGVCHLLGGFSVQHIAWISFVASIAFVLLSYILVKAIAGVRVGLLVSLLVLFSPLATALSRRALQDELVAVVTLLVITFFHLSWRRRWWGDPVFLAIFVACGLLLKEATLFIYPSLGIAAVYYLRNKPVGDWRLIMVALGVGPLIYLAIMDTVAGGLPAYYHIYREYSAMQSKLIYTMAFGRGAWFRYFVDYLLISPVTLALALASVAVPTSTPGERQLKTLSWIYLLGGALVFGMLPVLAVRVVLYIDVFIRALALLTTLWLGRQIMNSRHKAFARVVPALLVAIVLFFDGWQYQRIFRTGDVYDPTTVELIRANGFWQLWESPAPLPKKPLTSPAVQ